MNLKNKMASQENNPHDRDNNKPPSELKVDDPVSSSNLDSSRPPPESLASAVSSGPSQAPYLSRPLDTWSADEVADWISSLGKGFEVYALEFKQKNVTGRKLGRLSKASIKSEMTKELDFELFWDSLEDLKSHSD